VDSGLSIPNQVAASAAHTRQARAAQHTGTVSPALEGKMKLLTGYLEHAANFGRPANEECNPKLRTSFLKQA